MSRWLLYKNTQHIHIYFQKFTSDSTHPGPTSYGVLTLCGFYNTVRSTTYDMRSYDSYCSASCPLQHVYGCTKRASLVTNIITSFCHGTRYTVATALLQPLLLPVAPVAVSWSRWMECQIQRYFDGFCSSPLFSGHAGRAVRSQFPENIRGSGDPASQPETTQRLARYKYTEIGRWCFSESAALNTDLTTKNSLFTRKQLLVVCCRLPSSAKLMCSSIYVVSPNLVPPRYLFVIGEEVQMIGVNGANNGEQVSTQLLTHTLRSSVFPHFQMLSSNGTSCFVPPRFVICDVGIARNPCLFQIGQIYFSFSEFPQLKFDVCFDLDLQLTHNSSLPRIFVKDTQSSASKSAVCEVPDKVSSRVLFPVC